MFDMSAGANGPWKVGGSKSRSVSARIESRPGTLSFVAEDAALSRCRISAHTAKSLHCRSKVSAESHKEHRPSFVTSADGGGQAQDTRSGVACAGPHAYGVGSWLMSDRPDFRI